ncbi:thioesterase family protein [Hoyosella sp. YIM 151337]|uniref:thioesterase family protein n=1 Tax=Hoyosella sp. YIM 151337 TaxID=2992742 RepID=UPI00223694DB|nr:thioesterase family protein [Hoyosella sp. YIM 151337]MCW4353086.1 thioesterase family protein [Hoyosella sp. YIM 151337]
MNAGEPFYTRGPRTEGWQSFTATPSTVGVWSDSAQHGSPPATLLVKALEEHDPRADARISRVVLEILGPIPVTECRVRTWVQRPGKRVELLGAELAAPDAHGNFRAVARAHAWRLETHDTAAVADPPGAVHEPLVRPEEGEPWDAATMLNPGYITAIEWSSVRRPSRSGAPGQTWGRPLVKVVDDEPLSPLQRLFAVVDSANGIGAKLDIRKWTYLNTDLTVHVHRLPEGEWIGLSAKTTTGPDGIGMCSCVIYDEKGPVGRSAQTLLVRPR